MQLLWKRCVSTIPQESEAALKAFQARSGIDLPQNVLINALTHKSYTDREDASERYRMIGKSALSYYVTESIICQYPKMPAGACFSIVQSLIGRPSCSSIGKQLGVTMVMRWKNKFDKKEDKILMKRQARKEERVATDLGEAAAVAVVVESLIGALHQEAGVAVARNFIKAHFLSRAVDVEAHVDLFLKLQVPRLLLRRICKTNGLAKPIARLLKETGRMSSSPVFIVGIYSGVLKVGEGYGSSTSMAETRVNT
jgi:large subunit ribosomal protein L44